MALPGVEARLAALRTRSEEVRGSANALINRVTHPTAKDAIRRTVLFPLDDIDSMVLGKSALTPSERSAAMGDLLLQIAENGLAQWTKYVADFGIGVKLV